MVEAKNAKEVKEPIKDKMKIARKEKVCLLKVCQYFTVWYSTILLLEIYAREVKRNILRSIV